MRKIFVAFTVLTYGAIAQDEAEVIEEEAPVEEPVVDEAPPVEEAAVEEPVVEEAAPEAEVVVDEAPAEVTTEEVPEAEKFRTNDDGE